MIKVDEEYYLDRYQLSDEARLQTVINDEEIYKNTLGIPYPYTVNDAQLWLQQCEQQYNCGELQRHWTIRNKAGEVCGGIGLLKKYGYNSHKDEIGYWLMPSLWNQGLMTKVVKAFCPYCFNICGLIRLEAVVFDYNIASTKVLEKAGFKAEGKLRFAYRKDGKLIDGLLYAKIAV